MVWSSILVTRTAVVGVSEARQPGSTRSSHFMSSITNIRSSTMNGSPLDHLVPGRSSRVTVRPSSATA